jgi:hypothetical protein
MTSLDLTLAVSGEHTRDLRRAACDSRLTALARCCRPSTWVRVGRRLGATASDLRGSLARRHPASPDACACT